MKEATEKDWKNQEPNKKEKEKVMQGKSRTPCKDKPKSKMTPQNGPESKPVLWHYWGPIGRT